mmetsp:Transcript_14970/g.30421  ORF Transcript_14970/g.30421 Transcript_14970/m.30421 type:complete len:528 (-) Transcript_14970:1500-3083(-)
MGTGNVEGPVYNTNHKTKGSRKMVDAVLGFGVHVVPVSSVVCGSISHDASRRTRHGPFRVSSVLRGRLWPSWVAHVADGGVVVENDEDEETQNTQQRPDGPRLDPELCAILCVYLIQGMLGLSRLAVTFFLKDELNLDPTGVAALTGISLVPWLIKPVYGFISDTLPVLGYRRRPYLILSGIVGSGSWVFMSLLATNQGQMAVALTFASLSVAFADVVADSLVVERTRREAAEESGRLQSLCWSASSLGGLLSAYFSGSLLNNFTARQVFGATALLPLVTASLASLIPESRVDSRLKDLANNLRHEVGALWSALRQKAVLIPTLLLFFWQASPNVDSALFFFNTNVLHFDPEFLGRVRLFSAAASLAGVVIYQRLLKGIPVSSLLFGVTLLSVPVGSTQLLLVTHLNRVLGIDDHIFALADNAVMTALGYIAFMPTLVVAARLCPPGVEGALFATLMSIFNGAGVLSTELGAVITQKAGITEQDFTNLPAIVALCNVIPALSLPLIWGSRKWLDSSPYHTTQVETDK